MRHITIANGPWFFLNSTFPFTKSALLLQIVIVCVQMLSDKNLHVHTCIYCSAYILFGIMFTENIYIKAKQLKGACHQDDFVLGEVTYCALLKLK